MAATIAAARACASTLLHDSLAITAFKGAIPHVMIVLDQHPNTMQCVLAEGYHQVLQELNGTAQHEAAVRASKGHLLVPLGPTSSTPCGSSGVFLHAAPSSPVVSYSILPFEAENFLGDMGKMQSLLRQCGTPTSQCPAPLPQWTAEEFMAKYKEVEHYFAPLDDSGAPNRRPMEEACHDLRTGPARELLGFVLIQRNAFQNDMKKYRLRLALFDMGMRVAEHCHLECMSLAADAHVAEGRLEDAMLDDQVYSYPRSCSFSPKVAETLGKAIADSIDLGSWERQGAGTHEEVPSSVTKALQCPLVWNLFERGALCWENRNVHDDAASSAGGEALEQVLRLPITGPGTPLEIICKDASKVLTFSGGLEDCLMNTGAYVAAQQEDRNDVVKHRERFHTAVELSPEQQPESNVEQSEGAAAVQGRLKKKEYLALLRSRGEKPNKKPRVESGDDEEAASPRGSCINSSIGGTFPIGEVISESFDLSQLNGECHVFAYPDNHKQVAMSKPVPFAMTIQNGVVTEVSEDAPDDFVDLLSLVRHTEGACYVRELGIGLNPYVGLAHVLSDVTSFERQWGVHLSLGQRHPLFVKQRAKLNADGSPADGVSITGPVLKRKAGKFHIDVFVDVARLKMGKFEVDFTKGISVA